jgi:hypothetical protein
MTKKLLGAQRQSVWIVCSRELKFERDWNAWNQGQFWQVLGLFSSQFFPFLPSFLCFLAKAYIQALPTTLVQDTHSSCKQSFFLPSKPLPVTLVQDTFFSQASFFLPSKPLPSALVQDTHSSCKQTSFSKSWEPGLPLPNSWTSKILLESNHQIHDFLANPREDCTILEEIFSAKHCSHTAKVLSGNSEKRIQRNLLLREDLHSLRVS